MKVGDLKAMSTGWQHERSSRRFHAGFVHTTGHFNKDELRDPLSRASFGLALLALWIPPRVAQAPPSCRAAGELVRMKGLPEASGVAASRTSPGVLWSHNDSGEPTLQAVSADGASVGRLWVARAAVEDWEDISVGPCPDGSCIYIGDIGDNNAKRGSLTIYRVPEPDSLGDVRSRKTESMRLIYPDGPKDAEALAVLPNGSLLIVTKGERSAVVLYRTPEPFTHGATARLEPVATILDAAKGVGVARQDRVTGADASSDGRWIALRTLSAVTFYLASDLESGRVREVLRYDVSALGERQGEGVAFGSGGTVWLTSEGGGAGRPGTLAKLDCVLK